MCGCGIQTLQELNYHYIDRESLSETAPYWLTSRFNRWTAWIDLLHRAEEPRRHGEVELDRGDFHVSISFLVERWRWGRATVHKFFKDLESFGMITKVRQLKAGTTYRILDLDRVLPEDYEICCHCGLPDIKTPNTSPNSKRATKRDAQTVAKKAVIFYPRTANRTLSEPPNRPVESLRQMEIEEVGKGPADPKPNKRAANRTLLLGDGLPDVPKDLDTPELRRALELRIRERASQAKKHRLIPASLEALFEQLRQVKSVRGIDHAVYCLRRATEGRHQAAVFPEDLKPGKGEEPCSPFNPPASNRPWKSKKI